MVSIDPGGIMTRKKLSDLELHRRRSMHELVGGK